MWQIHGERAFRFWTYMDSNQSTICLLPITLTYRETQTSESGTWLEATARNEKPFHDYRVACLRIKIRGHRENVHLMDLNA